MAAISSEN